MSATIMDLFQPPPLPPRLQLVKQECTSMLRIAKEGVIKTVYVVVKNSPFHLEIYCTDLTPIDYNNIRFDATVVYDAEGDRQVDYVKEEPMSFRLVDMERDRFKLEVRIKILTSQHEDMLFRVRLLGIDVKSGLPIPSMTVLSAPIKVISKKDTKRHTKRKAVEHIPSSPDTHGSSTGTVPSPDSFLLAEHLRRIEQSEQIQQASLAQLHQKFEDLKQTISLSLPSSTPTLLSPRASLSMSIEEPSAFTSLQNLSSLPVNGDAQPVPQPKDIFEDSFIRCLSTFAVMNADDRLTNIRKVLNHQDTQSLLPALRDFIHLIWQEDPKRKLSSSPTETAALSDFLRGASGSQPNILSEGYE
jgi:hypothetical protein